MMLSSLFEKCFFFLAIRYSRCDRLNWIVIVTGGKSKLSRFFSMNKLTNLYVVSRNYVVRCRERICNIVFNIRCMYIFLIQFRVSFPRDEIFVVDWKKYFHPGLFKYLYYSNPSIQFFLANQMINFEKQKLYYPLFLLLLPSIATARSLLINFMFSNNNNIPVN